MNASSKMVIDDPSKFGLLATQAKEDLTKAALASANIMAALGRKEAVKIVQSSFINRNTFTVRQIQFTPMSESTGVRIQDIQATLGATEKAPYMARQEEGGKHKPSQGKTLAIPTNRARGGAKNRPVAAAMRVGRIGKNKRVRSPTKRDYAFWFRSEKAQNVARAYMAFKTGKLIPYGKGDQRNLFAVTSFTKTRKGVVFRLEQVYSFDKPETVTDAQPWLFPASDKVARQAQAIFNSQCRKLGL